MPGAAWTCMITNFEAIALVVSRGLDGPLFVTVAAQPDSEINAVIVIVRNIWEIIFGFSVLDL